MPATPLFITVLGLPFHPLIVHAMGSLIWVVLVGHAGAAAAWHGVR